MDGDELGAVGEGRLDLDVVDHRGDPVHHLVGGEHMRAGLHQFGDRAPVARPLDDEVGDQRDRLRVIELDAALEPPARHHRRHGDQKLVFFPGRQIHERASQTECFAMNALFFMLQDAALLMLRTKSKFRASWVLR